MVVTDMEEGLDSTPMLVLPNLPKNLDRPVLAFTIQYVVVTQLHRMILWVLFLGQPMDLHVWADGLAAELWQGLHHVDLKHNLGHDDVIKMTNQTFQTCLWNM